MTENHVLHLSGKYYILLILNNVPMLKAHIIMSLLFHAYLLTYLTGVCDRLIGCNKSFSTCLCENPSDQQPMFQLITARITIITNNNNGKDNVYCAAIARVHSVHVMNDRPTFGPSQPT